MIYSFLLERNLFNGEQSTGEEATINGGELVEADVEVLQLDRGRGQPLEETRCLERQG